MPTTEYPFIDIWGRMLGSQAYYIADEKARAKADNAPQTAIYKRQDGSWATVNDISSAHTKHQVEQLARERGIDIDL